MRPGWTRDQIAARAALELRDGDYVNLGIGLPTRVADHVPEGIDVIVHSENGVLGIGPSPAPGRQDRDLINAGTELVTVRPGASFVSSSESFSMIRGGHIDVTILGAMQVSAQGDLANWVVPGQTLRGIGGAMDLAAGAGRVIVLMEHLARDGAFKLVDECSLPLTGRAVVDLVITDQGVLLVGGGGFTLVELAEGVSVADVVARTGAPVSTRLTHRPRTPRGIVTRIARDVSAGDGKRR